MLNIEKKLNAEIPEFWIGRWRASRGQESERYLLANLVAVLSVVDTPSK